MKTLTHRLMIAAAAVAVVSGSAMAQSLKADIPFSFRAGAATLAPGSYTITTNYSAGRSTLIVHSPDTGAGVILSQYVLAGPSARSAGAKLTFECAGRDCVLRELSKGSGDNNLIFPNNLPHGDDRRIAVIPLTTLKSE
jgi:hypothetical protein